MMCVTPCVGVWIEIAADASGEYAVSVTPCVGVWIEIIVKCAECSHNLVTPCVGVWIEICVPPVITSEYFSHSLCGSVD